MRRAVTLLLALALVPALAALPPAASEPGPRASPAFDRDGNGVFDDLDAQVAAARPDDRLDAIVVFSSGLDDGLAALRRAAPSAEVRSLHPGLPAVALALPARDVARVAGLGNVVQVEPDPIGIPELTTSTHYLGVRATWNTLGVTGDADGNPNVFTKDDATIAVLDTGVHAAHLDFSGGKLIGWHDAVGGSPTPIDPDGHGTHVSSIATGRGVADGERTGVAPGASLVVVRISSKSNALTAVQWVMDHKDEYGIDVMTNSFGFGTGGDGTDSLSRLFDKAFEAGIVTVKSTGNSGPNFGTVTIPGDAHHILATGALEDPGKSGWSLATFSSRGPTADGRIKPDIAAPGVSISAARAGTTDQYVSFSGTSMAAPHTAGVAALVKAANPALTAAQIRAIIVATAQDRGLPGADNDYGAGLIDPYAAVQRARGLTGLNPVTSPVVFSAGDALDADVWAFDLGEDTHTLSVTFLADRGSSPRAPFQVVLQGPGGLVSTEDVSSPRHLNLRIPGAVPGVYTVTVAGTPGTYSLDASGDWNEESPAHGVHLPLSI